MLHPVSNGSIYPCAAKRHYPGKSKVMHAEIGALAVRDGERVRSWTDPCPIEDAAIPKAFAITRTGPVHDFVTSRVSPISWPCGTAVPKGCSR